VTQTQDFVLFDGYFAECVGLSCFQDPSKLGGSLKFVFDADTAPFPATVTIMRDFGGVLGPFSGELTPAGPTAFVGQGTVGADPVRATLRYLDSTTIVVDVSGPYYAWTYFGTPAPEPSTLLLLSGGIAGLVLGRTKRS
jgi:hypothetical protein